MKLLPRRSSGNRSAILAVVLGYASFGALWILLSDAAVSRLLDDPALASVAGTLKGLTFVAVTTLLLYLLLTRFGFSPGPFGALPRRSLRLPLSLVGLVVLAVTATAIQFRLAEHRQAEASRMQTIADTKTRQIVDWLRERRGDAQHLATDRSLAEDYVGWIAHKDDRSHVALVTHLDNYRITKPYASVTLLNPAAHTLWSSSGAAAPRDPRLLLAAGRAVERQAVGLPQPYRDESGRLHLGFMAPLATKSGQPGGLVILGVDPARELFPLLQSWPVPSASAEVLLFRRDGEQVLYLNELRHTTDAATRLRAPLATPALLAAQTLRGEIEPGRLFEGEDYRGVAVLGVARPIPGTEWHLIAKIDRAELFEKAWQESLWIGLAGLLTLLLATIGAILWRQHHRLAEATRDSAARAEKLRSLELLDNLVRSSDDIIYVKDDAGRYLLFNQAGCRFFNTEESRLLGKDAAALLPIEEAQAILALDRRLREENLTLTVEEELSAHDGKRFLLSTKGPLHDAEGEVIGTFCIARDITERKQMERELAATAASLKDSLARAQLLLDSAMDAVICIDQDGIVQAWNASAEAIFQHPAEQALGRSLGDLIVPPAFRERHRQGLERFIRTGQRNAVGKRLELTGMRADGAEFPIELTIGALRDGEKYLFTAYIRDISERRAAEDVLRASEQRFRDLVNTTDGIVWEADAKTFEFTFVNPQAERLLGYATQDWTQPGFWAKHLHPEDREWAPEYRATCAAGREPYNLEYRLIARDGRTVWVHDKVTVVTEDGAPRWLRGIMMDVSERRESDEMLRKLSLAVEQSPESIVITNIKAEIEYVNEAFCRTTGFRRDEVLGKNPRILHSGQTPSETYAAMWEQLVQGIPWKGEFFNRRKDGSEYVEFAIVTPIHQPDGSISHYVAVKEDITEKRRVGRELDQHRHHLEQLVANRTAQLEEARRHAEAANVAKSTFLANMSHEIRTPMNAIVGLTYILRRTQPTPEQADKLTKIDEAAEHLMAIINDILDLSKIEAGKLTLEQTDFSLSAILDHTQSLIADQARAKGIDVRLECEGVPHWLRGDPTRLRQALLNYAGNAVKFTKRGSITLRALLEEETADDVKIRFEVEDTGIGIPADQLPGLFQAFVQADASTTRTYGGTGLGLAISRRLATMMDGESGVESQVGRGSTFWFTVRLQRGHGIVPTAKRMPAAAEDDIESVLRRRHAGARILLAEDNAVNREVALELIHAAGLTADIAKNGSEAVAKATNIAYDLILMDVQMPVQNGMDATRAIRLLPGGARTPILAMTANAFDEDRTACREAGMSDFVAKPVDPPQFYAKLLKWLPDEGAASSVGEGAIVLPVATMAAPRPAQPDELLRRRLAGIPGLDLGLGLAMMRGNVDKFARLLVLFADGYHQHADQILSRLAVGDLAAIEPLAHSLRGSAGMLGAVGVSEAASTVLSAMDNNQGVEEIRRLSMDLAENLSRLVASIREESAELAEPQVVVQRPTRLSEVLAQLENFLEQGDMAASYLAKEEADLLASAMGPAAATMQEKIDAFDYEAAAATLREFRGNVGVAA
ncbi:MAG: PAS domain S-box protein [Rhodocyclales bacterium]|nr:PAS domain S-box protein [Rhodocyclales bacterium]